MKNLLISGYDYPRAQNKLNSDLIMSIEDVDGVVVHSLDFRAEGSGFESRPGPSESIKLFSSNKLIPSTQNSTNVDSHELHL